MHAWAHLIAIKLDALFLGGMKAEQSTSPTPRSMALTNNSPKPPSGFFW